MRSSFTRGLIVGSVIGTSIGMMVEPGIMNSKKGRKMMKSGRTFMRKTGNLIGDVVEIFR
jgi:hypothetical protein